MPRPHRAAAAVLLFALPSLGQEHAPPEAPEPEPEPEAPLNVLFVLADDLGWSDLGCYGNEVIRTPRIDALASEGIRFTDAYAPAPICSPTRAALMTGKAPARIGLTNHIPESPDYAPEGAPLVPAPMIDRLPLEEVTLAERLKAAGRATGLVGKWHLAGPWRVFGRGEGDPRFWPEAQGFDLNVGGCAFGGPPTYFDPYGICNVPPRQPEEYLVDRLADEARDFVAARREEPLLLCYWTYAVHWPIEAPRERVERYVQKEGPGLKFAAYGAMVSSFDAAVGEVLDQLEASGLADRTLVILVSDNGGWDEVADNRPLRGAKGYLFEGGIRVPLIVRWPGVVEPGSVCDTPVIGMDLTATVLDALGLLEEGDAPDGRSLLPLLRGGELEEEHPLFWHYPHYAWHGQNRPGGAVRLGRHKLIRRYDDESLELYDLAADIGETRDLAGEHPELAQELAGRLAAWLEATGARMPTRR